MALNAKTRSATRDAALDAFDALNSGFLILYTTAQPTDADTALGAQTEVATCPLGATAFAAASAGSKAANTISDDTSTTGGTTDWGTLTLANGTTRVMDFTVATSGANYTIDNATVGAGITLTTSSFTITQAA